MRRPASPTLLLGPLLRYVDERRATIWVETDRPCEVEVRVDSTRTTSTWTTSTWHAATWTVHGHHYALVVVDDLVPGSMSGYTVALDGEPVWPEPDSPYPPSVIRTHHAGRPFRLTFGSCRRAAPTDEENLRRFGADALVALADRLAGMPDHDGSAEQEAWPDLLLLAGDQVYADEPSDPLRHELSRIHSARAADRAQGDDLDPDGEVLEEIQTFEEYTWLYHESWMEPAVRWLLSTVPSVMMLDDHDLRDDWNTSLTWRRWATAQPWWRRRVVGAFASYWVHQHLGNLSPEELAGDRLYAALRAEPDQRRRDELIDDFAWRADAQPAGNRWSVHRDLVAAGRSIRLVVLDVRCSRALDPDRRQIVDEPEWQWFEGVLRAEPPVDHLLIGSTLPVLLPPGIHEFEGWNEAVAGGAWGRRAARLGEHIRQSVDLEHWAAFRSSLDRLFRVLTELAQGPRPPASVLLLSGDVHSSYVAEAAGAGVDPASTRIVQLTMSPFRNPLDLPIRLANRLLAGRGAHVVVRALRRRAGVGDLPLTWGIDQGIWFDNGLMTVVLDGRRAEVEVDHAALVGGRQVLQRTHTGLLSPPARTGRPPPPTEPG